MISEVRILDPKKYNQGIVEIKKVISAEEAQKLFKKNYNSPNFRKKKSITP